MARKIGKLASRNLEGEDLIVIGEKSMIDHEVPKMVHGDYVDDIEHGTGASHSERVLILPTLSSPLITGEG